MDIFKIAATEDGLSDAEIRAALEKSLAGRSPRKVLVIPPDFTRFHSNAGFITQIYYELLTARGVDAFIFFTSGDGSKKTYVRVFCLCFPLGVL